MRLRRSRCIVLRYVPGGVVAHNFLTGNEIHCNVALVRFLGALDDWRTTLEVLPTLLQYGGDAAVTDQLIQAGMLVVEGSPGELLETEFAATWEWGTMAAHYHFGIRDTPYLDPPAERAWMKIRNEECPSPALYCDNSAYEHVQRLPVFRVNSDLRRVMFDRRTERRFCEADLELSAISDCLFSGLGIVGFYDEPLYGRLPLKMAPSGGARNPYEAYLIASRVRGLTPGVYHYSSIDHSLGLITRRFPKLSRIVGNQSWADRAAAMIVLVANFSRDMWKYPHPAAYRCVLYEAGHIGQNILLTATELGLSGVPTAAINDSYCDSLLSLKPIRQAAVYTVSLGIAASEYRHWYDDRPDVLGGVAPI